MQGVRRPRQGPLIPQPQRQAKSKMYPSPSLTGGFKHHSTFSKEHDTAQPQHVKLEAVLPLHQSPQPKEQSRLLQMIYRGQVLARKSSIYITILTFLGLFYIFSSAAQSHPPSHPHATIVEEAYVTHLPCTPDPWVLISVQLLLFQTLHDALTSDPTREFVILTCPETPLEKCQELESHGAKLVTQTPWTLDGGRDSGSEEDGADYTPFQALLMDYDRVMYVDPGTILNRPLTDLWKKNEHGEHGLIGFRNPSGEIQLDQGFWMARPSSQLYEYIKLAIETKEPIPWRPIITK